MKKLPLLLLVLAVCLLTVGCGNSKPVEQQSPAPPPAVTSGPQSDPGMAGLLAKAKTVEGMSFDFVMNSKQMSSTGKMWVQGKKMRTEMTVAGQKMTNIFDGTSIYQYLDEEKLAIKLTPDKSQGVDSPLDYAGEFEPKADQFKAVESVVYEGVKCKLATMTSPDGKEQTKLWIREDYGFPMRVEVLAGNETTVMEYKNLRVGPQPAEMFTLPAGVKVMDMTEMQKQMPNMPSMPLR